MNKIKVIKRANLELPLDDPKIKTKKADAPIEKREAAQIVENWIEDWRGGKPKNARRAFTELFDSSPAIA
ncbi:MAG: hypothetical protein ABI891_15005 [Acidobacteriota bacterium]